jgi:osmotically-inducible protein OsmY
MNSNRLLRWCLASSLAMSLTPLCSFGQTTAAAGGTTGGTTIGTGGVGSTGGTGGTGTGGTNNQSGNSTNASIAAKSVQSITSGAGSATSIPSTANVFVQTYVDPLSLGVASKWNQFGVPTKPAATFGKAIYTTTTTTARGGQGAAGNANQQGGGFTTYGIPRTPSYSTFLDPELVLPQRSDLVLQSQLRESLARSSYLSNQRNIEIVVNGSTVELRGQVPTEKERRAAEGIVGTSPGVFGVINQLQVAPN